MARSQPAPTAAEEELAQREQGNQDTLAQRAKEEKAQQKQELRAGRRSPTTDIGDEPAELHRSDHVQLYTKTSGNRPDQYTQRNPAEEVAYGPGARRVRELLRGPLRRPGARPVPGHRAPLGRNEHMQMASQDPRAAQLADPINRAPGAKGYSAQEDKD
jgi:hypothetical protein